MNTFLDGELVQAIGISYAEALKLVIFSRLFATEEVCPEIDLEEGQTYFYLKSIANGIDASLASSHMIIVAIFLYSLGYKGYEQYTDEIPGGLTFFMGINDVRNTLGEPTRSGEAKFIPGLGDMPAWDRYDFSNVYLHCRYSNDASRILMITIGDLNACP